MTDHAGGPRIERVGDRHVLALVAFLERAYGRGLYSGEAGVSRWEWLYRRFPSAVPAEPPAWICLEDDGSIVGHCGALPVDVRVDDRVVPMAWARDLIVDPRVRGRGVGSRLMAETIAATGRCLILGEYDEIVAMYRRLGYRDRGRVPLFVKVLDPRAVAAAAGIPSPPRWAVASAIRLIQTRPPVAVPDGIEVERLARVDDRFDRLWSRVEPALRSVTVRRSSALLNWRYADHPSHRYRLLAVARDGEMRALAVVRLGAARGLPAGRLVELIAHPADRAALAAAASAAEAEMRAIGAVLARATVLHGPTARALVRSGYLPVPSRTRFMAAMAHGGADADPVLRRRDWYLNGGDSDIDVL